MWHLSAFYHFFHKTNRNECDLPIDRYKTAYSKDEKKYKYTKKTQKRL